MWTYSKRQKENPKKENAEIRELVVGNSDVLVMNKLLATFIAHDLNVLIFAVCRWMNMMTWWLVDRS